MKKKIYRIWFNEDGDLIDHIREIEYDLWNNNVDELLKKGLICYFQATEEKDGDL